MSPEAKEEAKDQVLRDLHTDLANQLGKIRKILDSYGLKNWSEYLFVRQPSRPESYIVLANEKDSSGFDCKLIEFHKSLSHETP